MQKLDNKNSYVVKNAQGVFIGYLNLKKDITVEPAQVSALLNGSSDMIIEHAEAQISENPFAGFEAGE